MELLGSDPRRDAPERVLISRTACNPLFLEETVRALAETAGLPADDKALLQAASVIGMDVPLVLLRAIAGYTDDDLRAALRRARAAAFL